MRSAAAADAQLHHESRALSFAVLILASLVTAWVVRRQLIGTVRRSREQEQRMSRLLGLGSDFTWEMDHRGHLTYLSPSFEQHTSHKVAEFMQLAKPGDRIIVEGQLGVKPGQQVTPKAPQQVTTGKDADAGQGGN